MKRSIKPFILVAIASFAWVGSLPSAYRQVGAAIAKELKPDAPQAPPVTGTRTRPGRQSLCPTTSDSLIVAARPKVSNIRPQSAVLWFYLPHAPEEIDKVRFLLVSNANRDYIVPPTPLKLDGTPGLIGVEIPPLVVGQDYTWTLSVFCDPRDREDRISFSGVVTVAERDASESPKWYEEFDRLARLRRDEPSNPALYSEWKALLESQEPLSNLVDAPLAPCCQL